MGVRSFVLTGFLILAPTTGVLLPAAQAAPAARGFICGTAQGAPSTNAIKADGAQVPVIRWTSTTFNAAGWSQERRCQEVSNRFNAYLHQGRLAYITTGRMNRLPVICTARNYGGACDRLLFTLKPGQNARQTLQDLLDIRVKARGPLNETTSRIYLSLDEIMSAAEAKETKASAMSSPPRTAPTAQSIQALF